MTIEERLKQHYDSINIDGSKFLLSLQGSQNYGLSYKNSDIDTKMIVIPSLKEIALNKKQASFTHVMENEEHCDVKDIRQMFLCFKKQNINFLEVLFSKYQIKNNYFEEEIEKLFKLKEQIAHYDNYAFLNCCAGMSYEKFNALKKPYPTTKWKIDKWGYDGKQLHHIMRMENFVVGYIKGLPFEKCLTYFPIHPYEELMEAKRNEYSLDKAESLALAAVESLNKIRENYIKNTSRKIDSYVSEEMDNILVAVLKKQLIKEVKE